MDFGIRGKVALIGGASQGIGLAAATALAREGARVAVCSRDQEKLRAAAEKVRRETGVEALAVTADLSRADDVRRALEEAQEGLGAIEILVTNTGGPRPGHFAELSETDWDGAYDLLLKSAIRLIDGVLPAMKENGWGRIIGVTSVAVKEPIGNLILSNVFRSGVTALFKTLSKDVARHGITVNTVLPGLTDTERLRGLYGAQATQRGVSFEQFMEGVSERLPLGRLTRAEELGEVIAYLASASASGITGSAIAVDGGQLSSLL